MRRIASILAGAALALSATSLPALEDDEIGVLRLFDEFVSSGAAASHCARPDDIEAARFMSNFLWISTHATREIERQSPGATPQAVSDELAKRSKEVKDRTHALVRAEGCEGAQVRVLVQRFAVQANWKRGS